MHGHTSRRLSAVAIWAAVALAVAGTGCSRKGSADGGSARVAISAAALSANVAEVIVTVSPGDGPAFTPFTADLSHTADGWRGFVTGIPVGPGRLFEVVANDASHARLYAGSAKADIVAGLPALVIVTLGAGPVDPYGNNAPVIDFVSAAQTVVRPGATVRLGISAHDPDPLDTVSIHWAAACGTFDDATRTDVTWTAPAAEGRCQITATASDNRGASVSVYLAIDVVNGTGDVLVQVGDNTSPVITAMVADVRFRSPVEGDLSVSAIDPDGDPLTYAWSSSCAAVAFGTGAASSTSFSNPDGSTSCVVTVTVTDGKGGRVIGAVTLPPRAEFNLGPVISHTVQPSVDLSDPRLAEPVQPGEAVTLVVDAYDPEGQQLTFSWVASAGTLDGQVDVRTSPGKSTVTFHAPSIVPANLNVTVTVADPVNESTSHQFNFKPAQSASPCAGRPDGSACDDGNPCTQTDTCQAGSCVGSNPVVCAPPAMCKQAGVCQTSGPNAGSCTYADAATGAACDDGRACTSPDACAAGVCMSGASTCPGGQTCSAAGQCVSTCTPSCSGRVCGTDGCGGSCGTCSSGSCNDTTGQCVAICTPNCSGRTCGPDGCGGTCGTCTSGTCNDTTGQCLPPATTTRVVPKVVRDVRVTPPAGVAIDTSGNSYVVGNFGSIVPIDFQTRAGGPAINLTSQGASDGFVAKYDVNGDITWAVLVGDNNPAIATDQAFTLAAVTQSNRVAVIGKFAGTVTFGTTSAGGANPLPIVAALNGADGSRAWVNGYDLGSNGLFWSLATNPSETHNRIAACGFADGAATTLDPSAVYGGSQDAVIGAWDAATGAKLWGKQIGTTALNETCAAVAIDANGDVVAVGQYDGATIDLGNGFVLTGPNSTARKFLWIARFNGATGQTLAARAFNGTLGNAIPRSLAIAPNGDIAIGGSFTGNLTIGAAITTAGSEDGFVALLDAGFNPVWNAVRIGGTALDLVRSVAFTSAGDIVALGNFAASSVSFRTTNGADTTGLAALTSAGGIDAMVIKLNGQTGATDEARSYGNAGTQSGDVIAVNRFGANQVVFTNTSGGTVLYGTQSFTATAANDAALVFARIE